MQHLHSVFTSEPCSILKVMKPKLGYTLGKINNWLKSFELFQQERLTH